MRSRDPVGVSWRLVLVMLLGLPTGAAMAAATTVVFLNGAVHTMDAHNRVVPALVVDGDRIAFVGDDAGARRAAAADARVIDLDGRMLLPGFRDSHMHPGIAPNPATQLDLGGLLARERILARIAAFAAAHAERPWIVGTGWDEAAFLPAGQPTRQMLDSAVPDRPAFLSNNSQHMAWVNGAALRAAGIDRGTPDPPNGRIERDAAGDPTGVLQESAMDLVRRVIPPPPTSEQVQNLLAAMDTLHRHGITACEDAMVRPEIVPAYLALARDSRLRMRGRLCLWFDPDADDDAQLRNFIALRAQFAATPLRADCVKIVLDGAYASHTLALLEPYHDEPATFGKGKPFVEPARLDALVTLLDREGFSVHVHALGDAAVRIALDAFEAARNANGARDLRHTIAHLALVDRLDLPRFAALGIVANMSPLWSRGDPWETVFAPRLFGVERTARLYPARSLLDAGAQLVWGSDWPVTDLDPLAGIETAVTHRYPGGRDPSGREDTAWNPGQRVTLDEALRAYTSVGASLAHEEGSRGVLRPGAFADLTVLGADLYAIDPLEIHAVTVDLVMAGGRIVHRRDTAR